MIDNVAKTVNCEWEKVLKMPILYFLNVYCYYLDKEKNNLNDLNKINNGFGFSI